MFKGFIKNYIGYLIQIKIVPYVLTCSNVSQWHYSWEMQLRFWVPRGWIFLTNWRASDLSYHVNYSRYIIIHTFILFAHAQTRILGAISGRLFYLNHYFKGATVMFGATVSTPLPLLLEVPLRLRLGLRLVPRYRYCLEFRALRLGSLLGLGLPVPLKV